MVKKPPVHVAPRENGWAVVREGNDRATSVRRTQAQAAREGRDIARRHETGFLLHGKDGRIREHNDYGNGHRPQEGTPAGRATEAFAPGTRALGEPTANEEGQNVQRTTDEQGDIVETAFDAEGKVTDETPVGSVADLPGAEGHEETTDEEGITKRVAKDDSGVLIEVRIGPDGSVLGLQIPPGTEKVEETAQQVGQAAQGAQDGAEQATDQAQATTGQAAGQARRDGTGGAARQTRDTAGQPTEQADQAAQGGAGQQAQDATGQGTDLDRGPAGQTAGQKAPGGQDTEAQTTRQGNGGRRQDGEQAEGQGPSVTPAARRKAEELGADLTQTEGTGSDGRITVEDVKKPAEGTEDGAGEGPEASGAARRKAEELGIDLSQIEGSGSGGRVTVKDVTSTTEGAQEERATGGDQRQDEDRGTEEQGRKAEGGAGDVAGPAAGQAVGQAVRVAQDAAGRATGRTNEQVRDTTERVTEQARGLVGSPAGLHRQDEDRGQGGSQDTAGSAARGDDREARQGGDGQEPDATDAVERKAGGAGVGSSKVEGFGAQGRTTVNDGKGPSGPAKGKAAGEQKKPVQAGQAAQGVGDTAGQAAQQAGGTTRASSAAPGSASGDADRTAGRSGRAPEGARGSGTLEDRTDNAQGARGVTDRGRDDDHFEMVGEGYADYEVYGQDGERLGKVDHLFLDGDDRPEYVGVEIGLPDGRAVLVPVEVIPAENERRVVVSRPKGVVERGPTFGDGGEVTPELEERVRKHYGLPIPPGTEGRSGPDAPLAEGQTGGEREGSGAAGSGMRIGDTETDEFREHDRNVEGVGQPGSDLEDELRVRRSEEELRVGTREREAGFLNVRKRVRTDRERVAVPTRREEVSVERVPVEAEAPGTRIGSDELRMPVTEDEVTVEKRPVVKEVIRIRKDVVEDTEVVEEDVRREEIEVDDRTERRTRQPALRRVKAREVDA